LCVCGCVCFGVIVSACVIFFACGRIIFPDDKGIAKNLGPLSGGTLLPSC